MHICALFYCCSILHRYVQRATHTAQFHLVPISLTENSLPPPLCLPLSPRGETHLDTHRHELQRMQRYRSYIEVAFQRSPHRVDDRGLLQRKKGMQGETSSLKRILEKYIEKSPLWTFSFTFRNNFIPFFEMENCAQLRGGGRKGGMLFFWVDLKCKGCNENQLAGRHYLSIVVQECIDMKRKNRPSPNPVRPALFFAFLPSRLSPCVSFSR